MEHYYTPSGKYSPLSFALWLVVAFTALPLLAVIYAFAIWYIPVPYVNFLLTMGLGLGVGIVISKTVLRYGKVRNPKLANIFTIFGALTTLYIHWAVWVDLALNIEDTYGSDRISIATSSISFDEIIGLLVNPIELFSLMSQINEVGVWGIRGITVSGAFLALIWILEIAMTCLFAFLKADQSAKPFNEQHNNWFTEEKLKTIGYFDDPAGLVNILVADDSEALQQVLQPAGNIKKESHAEIDIYDAQSGENYVTIFNRLAKTNKKGEIEFNEQVVTKILKVSQTMVNQLRAVGAA